MPTIHDDALGVTAGGYTAAQAAANITPSTTIYASQVIESSQRRFITDAERYAIANIQLNGMLKSSYDADGDGMVDVAYKALIATNANNADNAGNAVNAVRAGTADTAVNADHAITADNAIMATNAGRADIADKSVESDHATLADSASKATEATHAVTANTALKANEADEAVHAKEADHTASADRAEHANEADHAVAADRAEHAKEADHATSADKAKRAEVADSVQWDNVEEVPNFALKSDLSWDNIKDSAPNFIADTSALESRIDSIEESAHSHYNIKALEKITSDTNDMPLWNGLKWPAGDGDMKKAIYDADGDGIVDQAKTVNWQFITNLPTKFTPEDHSHLPEQISQNAQNRFVSDLQIGTWNAKQDALGFVPEDSANRGIANGYATLDADGKLTEEQVRELYWEQVKNRPASLTDDIDDAVSKKHFHVNATALERLTENDAGMPIWNNMEWPYTGDMHMSTYDVDGDGIVDRAKIADSVAWSSVTSKPISEVSDIDEAVSKKHAHVNIGSLELLGKDALNNPLWNGDNWPYDMRRSVYDTDSDGVVDEAEVARSVKWSGILGKPVADVASIDEAVAKMHSHDTNSTVLDGITTNASEERLSFKGKDVAFLEDIAAIPTPSGDVQAKHSIEVDLEDLKLHLVNDDAFPEANSYYGTNNEGIRGFHPVPSTVTYRGINSIEVDSSNRVMLKNDNPSPMAECYYGTDEDGELGYHKVPTVTTIEATKVVQDATHRFVTDEQLTKLNAIEVGSDSGDTPSTPTVNDPDTITGPEALSGTRECVISAMDGYFALNGSDLILKATENDPIVASFSNGRNKEIIKTIKSNMTVANVPSIINEGTVYIYLELDGDTVVAKKTALKPTFSYNMPSEKEDGRYWFNINTFTMYKGTGSTYILAENPILFIGEISAANGKVVKTAYALNGLYDSGWYNVSYGTTYNRNHNLGTDIVNISAYRGLNGVNMGEFAFALHGSSISEAIAVGDRVSKITENTIQTTRYNMVQFGAESIVYGNTNQHRVIVHRGW